MIMKDFKDVIIEKQKEHIKKLEGKFQSLAGLSADMVSNREDLSREYELTLKAKEKLITAQKALIKNFEESGLAGDGIYCRVELSKKYISIKVRFGDISNDPEVWERVKEFLGKLPIDYLWSEVQILERRHRERLVKRRTENFGFYSWNRFQNNFL